MSDAARAWRDCGDSVGGVFREECPEQELRAQEGEVRAHFKSFGFLVKVGDRCHPEGASGYPEGRVLDGLEG